MHSSTLLLNYNDTQNFYIFEKKNPIRLLLVKLEMTLMLEKVQGQSDSGENDDEII